MQVARLELRTDECTDERRGAVPLYVRLENGRARIGITDATQRELETIVRVQLVEVGSHLRRAAPFGEVESARAVSELLSPLSGLVVERTREFVREPGLINADPYGSGWLLAIEMEDARELEQLLTAEEYSRLQAPAGHGFASLIDSSAAQEAARKYWKRKVADERADLKTSPPSNARGRDG